MTQILKFRNTVYSTIILILIVSCSCIDVGLGQQKTTKTTISPFFELNGGIAFIYDSHFPFPGGSILFGATMVNRKNFIFEFEVGAALPTIGTAKVGVGKKFDRINVVAGVRPYPFNCYLQSSFMVKEKGYWIASLEVNPYDHNREISAFSNGLINFGYRWHINAKQE